MKQRLHDLFPQRWQDTVTLVVLMFAALDLCLLLQPIGADEIHAALIHVLSVFLVSRFTDGYLYGTIASLISVVVVNYAFVYPYYAFNVSVAGYPLTAAVVLTVSVMTTAMTTSIKAQEGARVAAERERLRANLMRSVGHDLRTPLTSIIGSSGLLIESGPQLKKEERYNLMLNVKSEAEWMLCMVENLLSITRGGSDPAQLKKRPEAVEEVIGEVVGKFHKRFPSIQAEVTVPDDCLEVPMDAMLIEQVLTNLMENAVFHGGATLICITVRGRDKRVAFTVSDNGGGIPPDRMAQLFKDYMEVASEEGRDSRKNMGIGLIVCKEIVSLHGGELFARNCDGGGAEFTFLLPGEEKRHGSYQRQASGH